MLTRLARLTLTTHDEATLATKLNA